MKKFFVRFNNMLVDLQAWILGTVFKKFKDHSRFNYAMKMAIFKTRK
jgi:hypothetical protein